MKTSLVFIIAITFFRMAGLHCGTDIYAQSASTVTGIVFHDKNGSGHFEADRDVPLQGVAVSNGREVAVTDSEGKYQLPLRNNSAIFVIKPSHWMVLVDDRQLPRFYHMHSTGGATGTNFKGLPATGPLTGPLNFPLYPSDEPDRFDVLVFGDTQPRDHREIYYLASDALAGLAGVDAAFGVTLGDVVFDDLNLFEHLTQSIATIGIPWRYVPGNHDIDFSADNDSDARGAWYRTFGPSYYSFSYGPAHFIVMDNIRWIVEEERRHYRTGLGEDQMEFLRNEISRLGSDQLLVLMTHIPYEGSTAWQYEEEQKAFYELIAGHPNSVTLAAHTHRHYHHLIGSEEGFPGERPHHMVSVGTVCGAWWTGAPDEYGIPHAMMSDGTPTSYTFLHIDGNSWKMSWRASRRPDDFQMYISAPDVVESTETPSVTITANIFNALPSAMVRIRIGNNGGWRVMERVPGHDPSRLTVAGRESELGEVPWRNLGNPQISEHLWVAEPGVTLETGVYTIEVHASDDWWEYSGRRLIHVK